MVLTGPSPEVMVTPPAISTVFASGSPSGLRFLDASGCLLAPTTSTSIASLVPATASTAVLAPLGTPVVVVVVAGVVNSDVAVVAVVVDAAAIVVAVVVVVVVDVEEDVRGVTSMSVAVGMTVVLAVAAIVVGVAVVVVVVVAVVVLVVVVLVVVVLVMVLVVAAMVLVVAACGVVLDASTTAAGSTSIAASSVLAGPIIDWYCATTTSPKSKVSRKGTSDF